MGPGDDGFMPTASGFLAGRRRETAGQSQGAHRSTLLKSEPGRRRGQPGLKFAKVLHAFGSPEPTSHQRVGGVHVRAQLHSQRIPPHHPLSPPTAPPLSPGQRRAAPPPQSAVHTVLFQQNNTTRRPPHPHRAGSRATPSPPPAATPAPRPRSPPQTVTETWRHAEGREAEVGQGPWAVMGTSLQVPRGRVEASPSTATDLWCSHSSSPMMPVNHKATQVMESKKYFGLSGHRPSTSVHQHSSEEACGQSSTQPAYMEGSQMSGCRPRTNPATWGPAVTTSGLSVYSTLLQSVVSPRVSLS
ncbi:serine/arginine repetitive matrix protein 1-like [Camelus ferus]|uniref:Serine/arginine repetitive matrix protein 1-like n=1 Tax=Camelus ferus TaxID=419612 RepID=A0A8B8TDD8_CAMFR|nr:serine/arginine repetitive matrix protein 1-like [Camelus ferus]